MIGFYWICVSQMGRVTSSSRQLYEETILDQMKLQAALVDPRKNAFDLLLKLWNLEQAAYVH